MRKAQKKKIEDLLGLLDQAHDEIRTAIEQKNIPAALRLLADCQDGAIVIGNLIEKTEEKALDTIESIEEYCELVYQVYEELGQDVPVQGNKIYKVLRKAVSQVRDRFRQEIKVRLEVVFLPYKASMWDSLESVWKAADEDLDCDAYVIPIPYYDRNPDGSFGEMHYEADLYPDDVPVIKYDDYDFENRKPDMIFIHNPYDDCNYVTSVLPYFYSRNLKKYTERLVYIPYFILDEFDPEDKNALENNQHFCTVPGVINADQVIVQSEAMRKAYIKVITKYILEQSFDPYSAKAGRSGSIKAAERDIRKHWENKILGLGSPKVDKISNTKKEDVEIPEQWLNVIRKPSGEWKKIILYNTSVGALLRYDRQILDKMKQVFQTFKEHQQEVALLWRPHPLIRATIESMRPQLWMDYREIVETYREEGWGIYDDTAELDRALVLSSGYYGDPSSLVPLCKSIGLPVMIQDPEV